MYVLGRGAFVPAFGCRREQKKPGMFRSWIRASRTSGTTSTRYRRFPRSSTFAPLKRIFFPSFSKAAAHFVEKWHERGADSFTLRRQSGSRWSSLRWCATPSRCYSTALASSGSASSPRRGGLCRPIWLPHWPGDHTLVYECWTDLRECIFSRKIRFCSETTQPNATSSWWDFCRCCSVCRIARLWWETVRHRKT